MDKNNKFPISKFWYSFLVMPGLLLLVSVFLPWFSFTFANGETYSVNALGWKSNPLTSPNSDYRGVLLAAIVGIISGDLLISLSVLAWLLNSKRAVLSLIGGGFLNLPVLWWAIGQALDVFDVLDFSASTQSGFGVMFLAGVLILIGNVILLLTRPYSKQD